MKIKKIILENIRSYEHVELEFPEGSILLWGDIGSGKTSILLSIEFALFGLQPGQRGSSLLRNGADSGKVILDFEIDEKIYSIERILKRGKTISQESCSINYDNEKREISVTELKDFILELLEYPKEFTKKQNLLYKFTVYTPQEQMKQIILEDPINRLNTLRHVFGVDKYKKVLENISIISAKIREEKRMCEAMSINLESEKEQLVIKQMSILEKEKELSNFEEDLEIKIKERKQKELEKQFIEEKVKEKNKLEQEIEKTSLLLSTKTQMIIENNSLMHQIDKEIKDSSNLVFDSSKIFTFEKKINELNAQKTELNEKSIQINSKIHSLNSKNKENELTKRNLSKLEMCPTCLQDVDPVYKSNAINKIDSDTSSNTAKIKELSFEKNSIESKQREVEQEIYLMQKQINDLNLLKLKLQNIDEKKQRRELLNKQNLMIEKDSKILEEQISLLKNSVFELSKFNSLFESKQREFEQSQKNEKLAEIKIAELKKEISVFMINVRELEERIKKAMEIRSKLGFLSELEDWISKKFMPIISYIEKNVMIKLKSNFSKLFSEWFSMLVPGNFNVKLSDDFTPIIEQQDYELDYNYLSGGERTAIALAYRLALNQVINSLLSKIKTKDIVILDEPTDGFSEQQLDKMRDVLQQLNVSQLIIVSHETKIESFVENVIRFRKENGNSKKD